MVNTTAHDIVVKMFEDSHEAIAQTFSMSEAKSLELERIEGDSFTSYAVKIDGDAMGRFCIPHELRSQAQITIDMAAQPIGDWHEKIWAYFAASFALSNNLRSIMAGLMAAELKGELG